MSRPERGQKRQREEDEAGPSRQPKEDVNDEASKPKKRDLEAEERVFGISLLRMMILRDKVKLEYWVRRDGDIRKAVKDWLENRYVVNLFQTSTGTTSWAKFFSATRDEECVHEKADDDNSNSNGVAQPDGFLPPSDGIGDAEAPVCVQIMC